MYLMKFVELDCISIECHKEIIENLKKMFHLKYNIFTVIIRSKESKYRGIF